MALLASSNWGEGPRLVLCHGFTQTRGAWGLFGESLATHHTIVAVDLPGHGAMADLDLDVVNTAHALLDTVGDEPFSLLGYSMGGRVALTAAMMQPRNLEALVLLGASPGIANEEERLARIAQDNELADELAQSGDVAAFLDRWLAQPLFAGLDDLSAQRAARLANTAEGLARSLRRMGTGTQQSAWGFLDMIEAPTLLIAGERDQKFTAIAHAMSEELPNSTVAIAPQSGHACHLEHPEAVAQVVTHWLEAIHASAKPKAKRPPTNN